MTPKRIAIVGGGIAGLSAAWLLSQRHRVTLYEKNAYLGGHAHTVDVETSHGRVGVDTGFVVFNERNYPHLTRLFRHLGISSQATDMSFALSLDDGRLEWAGDNLNTLFAQRRNLLRPAFWRFAAEILRFNRQARRDLDNPALTRLGLGEYLERHHFRAAFRDQYLLPMAGAIWSCPPRAMERFPVVSFLRFFANHGLLDLVDRPQWRTVTGGSRRYVERLVRDQIAELHTGATVRYIQPDANGVTLHRAEHSPEHFDAVILACHADEAVGMLDTRAATQRRLLGAIGYQANRTCFHTDARLMPKRRRVWSSWNYLSQGQTRDDLSVSVTYWMNRLHRLRCEENFFVSLNPLREPRGDSVICEQTYHHPVFDEAALSAQSRLGALQGQDNLWFTGSYMGNGFHEDALDASLRIAHAMNVHAPWEIQSPTSPPLVASCAS